MTPPSASICMYNITCANDSFSCANNSTISSWHHTDAPTLAVADVQDKIHMRYCGQASRYIGKLSSVTAPLLIAAARVVCHQAAIVPFSTWSFKTSKFSAVKHT